MHALIACLGPARVRCVVTAEQPRMIGAALGPNLPPGCRSPSLIGATSALWCQLRTNSAVERLHLWNVQSYPDCKTAPYRCSPNKADDAIYAFLIASLFVYWIGTGFFLRRSFIYLRTKPYNQMRMANQHLRINVGSDTCTRPCSSLGVPLSGLCLSYFVPSSRVEEPFFLACLHIAARRHLTHVTLNLLAAKCLV